MGCTVCSLAWRNGVQLSKSVQYLLSWLFYGILIIHIFHQASKAQSRISVHSCQNRFVASQGYQHQPHLPACSGLSHQEICPTAMGSVCLFCWQTEQFLLAFCAWDGAKETCLDAGHLCTVAVPIYPLISWTQVATTGEHTGIYICIDPITFQTWKGLLMAISMLYFNEPLEFP